MKNEGYDQRVRLTKAMIKHAFLDLLSTKNIRHISVRELCEKAQINRATFYSHYMDIYDLKEQLENQLIESIIEVFKNVMEKNRNNLLSPEIFATVFSLLRENSELCTILLNCGDEIIDKCVQMSQNIFMDIYKVHFANATEEKLNAYFLFVSSGCIAMVKKWLLYNPEMPASKVADVVAGIMQKGIFYLN